MWAVVCTMAVGLWTSWRWAAVCSMLAVVWLYWHAPATVDPWLFGTQLSLWVLLPGVVWHLQHMHGDWQRRSQQQVNRLQQQVVERQEQIQRLEHRRDHEAHESSQLIELYRVTKETAGAVHMAEFFRALTHVLTTVVTFEHCWLLLIDQAVEGHEAQYVDGWRCRNAAGTLKTENVAATLPPWSAPLLAHVIGSTVDESAPPGVAWAPLTMQQQVLGILVCEGLPERAFDQLHVIAHQVALQVQRIRLYEHLEQLSVSDSLTGLAVRRHFEQRLAEELERAGRRNFPMALLLGDLDWFKALNDTHGHLVGDQVLRRVSALLKANLREIDLVGRYGGEEFILALVDTAVDEGQQVAERIRAAIADDVIHAYDETVRVTISIGMALYPQHGRVARDLIEHADQALYQAKAVGRNAVHIYTADESQQE